MYVTIDASEVHNLARDIHRHAGETPAKARKVMAAGAYRIVAAVQAEILRLDLVDTGNMVGSVGADIDGLMFEVGSTAEYTIYQELGTSELPANNFTAHGFDVVAPQIYDAVADMGAQLL